MLHRIYVFFCGMLITVSAAAQLNENCVVSVLNRNVTAKSDGSWVLPNIPANFGKVRARATCVQGGVTSYGQSSEFTLSANNSVSLEPIVLGPVTPIPAGLRVSMANDTLTRAGTSTQIKVIAAYAAGEQIDVSRAGTSYSVSNSAIATVTPAGLVTAVSSGSVMIQAINEGAQGVAQLRIALSTIDADGDGIPDEVELQLGTDPNSAADAQLDLDHDGLTAIEEYRAGTDPRKFDTDGDGLSDGEEVHCTRGFCTSPVVADSDGDGVRDATELLTGTDPTSATSVNWGAALRGIRVTPAGFDLIVNSLTGTASIQLAVIGTMIDGFEANLTSSARQTGYASSNLKNCNFGGANGLVYAATAGPCEIIVSNNGHTAIARGTVQDFVPSALSILAIPGFANGLAVEGDFAYIAAGAAGLQVVALGTDRRAPKILASLNLSDYTNDVAVLSGKAYVATSGGIKIVDITKPEKPQLLGSFEGAGNAMGVKVRASIAYFVAGDSLHIVNIAKPDAIVQVGILELGGTGWNLGLDITRNLAAVAMGEAGLKLVDISLLSAPRLLGTAVTGDARGVALIGNTAVVADFVNSMTSVDIGDAAAPKIISSTPPILGGLLNGVTLSDNFALGADISFVNGVPIIDVSNPQILQPRTILNFVDRDDNGMAIAADDNYVYLVTDHDAFERGGSTGDSRLYIGKYQPDIDAAGLAPKVTISAPADGTSIYEGETITVTVDATDDISVATVRFLVNNQEIFSSTSAPYQFTFPVPTGVPRLELGAIARDLGGNEGVAAPIHIEVAPDPLTQAVGQVIGTDGTPLVGAVVTAPGGRTAISGFDGRFQIADIPTTAGNLVLQASYVPTRSFKRQGSSNPTAPVRAGMTDIGQITVIEAQFETNYGVLQTRCTNCHVTGTLPFLFPFYGVKGSELSLDASGSIETRSTTGTYTGYIHAMYGGIISNGGVWVNDQVPGRYVITYDNLGHFVEGGSNTFQIQLFHNGRIIIAFKGVTLRTSFMTGILPTARQDTTLVSVIYSAKGAFESPIRAGIVDFFTKSRPFDLDNGIVAFTPLGVGYSVRTVLPPAPSASLTLTGALSATRPSGAPSQLRASAKRNSGDSIERTLASAEVRVSSSGNPKYLGLTNTDPQGRFTLKGVPPGGINVEVWRNGRLVARGSELSAVPQSTSETLHIDLRSPEVEPKN